MKKFIYALKCPITDEIHYIGKTERGMLRPREHFSNSHSEKINEWVSELKSLDLSPNIEILEHVKFGALYERERYWISKCISDGCDLLNESLLTPMAIIPNYDELIGESQFDGFLEISRLIKARRKAHGLTQVELSEKLGIALTVVRKIEQGNVNISLLGLINILKAFNLTLSVKKINKNKIQ